MHEDPASDLGKRTRRSLEDGDEIGTRELSRMNRRKNKIPHKKRLENGSSGSESEDEEMPVKRSHKKLHREVATDDQGIPLKRSKHHREMSSDDEELPLRKLNRRRHHE